MKSLFFGTTEFAVPSLDVLADRTALLGVVTQPDRPAGRGQRLAQSPVKRAALARSLRVYEPTDLRAFAAEIRDLDIDCCVVAAYGRILPRGLLDVPAMGSLGVHPSLLPRYRGATPIQAALLAGDRETGVTIMLMDAGMDTGDVVLQERVEIGPDEDFGALHSRLAVSGAHLLGEALERGERAKAFEAVPQNGPATSTRPIEKEDLEIDWKRPTRQIVDQVRAYAPRPAARGVLENVRVKILKAAVTSRSPDALFVPSGDGTVAIERVVAPNHAPETGASFARRIRPA